MAKPTRDRSQQRIELQSSDSSENFSKAEISIHSTTPVLSSLDSNGSASAEDGPALLLVQESGGGRSFQTDTEQTRDKQINSCYKDEESQSVGSRKASKVAQHKFLGVRQRPSGRWVAEIKDSSQKLRLWLGTFDTPEEAARAYDEAARVLRGRNTRTNFATSAASRLGSLGLASKAARLLFFRLAAGKPSVARSHLVHEAAAPPFFFHNQPDYFRSASSLAGAFGNVTPYYDHQSYGHQFADQDFSQALMTIYQKVSNAESSHPDRGGCHPLSRQVSNSARSSVSKSFIASGGGEPIVSSSGNSSTTVPGSLQPSASPYHAFPFPVPHPIVEEHFDLNKQPLAIPAMYCNDLPTDHFLGSFSTPKKATVSPSFNASLYVSPPGSSNPSPTVDDSTPLPSHITQQPIPTDPDAPLVLSQN
eukprot:c8338_g1_i1 orf=127-1386(+)